MRDPQRAGVAALIALTCSGAVVAADPDPFVKGPYLQNVTRSSVTVMWESAVETRGQVTVLADPPLSVDSELAQIHEVVIDGLEPGRRYRYRVRAGSGERVGELATAPESDAPYSFIVFGDSRSNAAAHRRVVERIRREVPDFLLNTGDMVNEGASAGDWQQFFDIEREILAENVLYPSVGNHDRQGRGRTADNYRKYFSLPENSPDPERYYAFTYGNSRFLILDSNAYSFALTDQTAWIEEQLQAARLDPAIAHIFVTMHHPPYSISLHGGHAELREAWTPLYEKYQVAAVFSGHDHVYSRAEAGGVRYFVSGGGGAPLYPRRSGRALDERATVYFERVNHYIRVHVIGGAIEVSAFRADGTLIEALSWGKRLPEPERARRIAALGKVEPGPVDPTRAARPPDVADDPRIAAASPGDPARFGWRGIVGLLLAIGGGLVLVRAARG